MTSRTKLQYLTYEFAPALLDAQIWLELGRIEALAHELKDHAIEHEAVQPFYNLEFQAYKNYSEQELSNLRQIYQKLTALAFENPALGVTPAFLEEVNGTVLKDIPQYCEHHIAGKIRDHSVSMKNSKYPEHCIEMLEAHYCHEFLERSCEQLHQRFQTRPPSYQLAFGLLYTILFHFEFLLIHPFSNGNGRTGRAVEYYLLLKSGFPVIACNLMNNLNTYNRPKLQKLIRSYQRGNDLPVELLRFCITGYRTVLEKRLKQIRAYQDECFISYLSLKQSTLSNPKASRQGHLLFHLSQQEGDVSSHQLHKAVCTKVDGYTDTAFRQDLKQLSDRNWISCTPIAQGEAVIRLVRDSILEFHKVPYVKDNVQ